MAKLKQVLFRIAAIAIPLLLILAVELVLRAMGADPAARRVFEAVPGKPDYLALSPDYVQRYFTAFRPAVPFNPFRKDKSAATFRIFVLGGSSTAGFPYPFYDGFPARLADRLAAAAPGHQFEVINLGMTAVNSYTLWDLRKSIVAQDPDAIIIYAGHNEYYGAFGAGSGIGPATKSVTLTRLSLRLKRWIIYRWLERTIVGKPKPADDRTLMARAVGEARIPRESGAYVAGIRQFNLNMQDVLETFRDAGVPVFIGTLAANLRSQLPLGENEEAVRWYREGSSLYVAGDTSAARRAFIHAKDEDDIRFRAPSAINDAIGSFADDAVTVVSIEDVLVAHSRSGIEDDEHFTDHLHPNYRGYQLIANAFLDALQKHSQLASTIGSDAGELETGLQARPPDPVGAAYAELQIERLKAGFPFTKGKNQQQEMEVVRQLFNRRLRSHRYADSLAAVGLSQGRPMPEILVDGLARAKALHDTTAALSIYRSLVYWQPFNHTLQQDGVAYALENPRFDAQLERLALFSAARSSTTFHRNALALIYLRGGRLDEAGMLLDEVERVDPSSEAMLFNKARLLVLRGDTTAARVYFERYRRAAAK